MKILAVSAHPDDETLGCGGTLLKHKVAGDRLDWLITTQPGEGRFSAEFIARRRKQINAVQKAYGFGQVHQLEFFAAELDRAPFGEVIEATTAAVKSAEPDRVYVVHPGDVHSEHRITFDAVWAALKPFRRGQCAEVYCYETASSTNMAPPMPGCAFVPTAYCDIGEFLDRKLEIFRIYESEVQAPPGPRSIESVEALARWRGSAVGLAHAEAFNVVRALI